MSPEDLAEEYLKHINLSWQSTINGQGHMNHRNKEATTIRVGKYYVAFSKDQCCILIYLHGSYKNSVISTREYADPGFSFEWIDSQLNNPE